MNEPPLGPDPNATEPIPVTPIPVSRVYARDVAAAPPAAAAQARVPAVIVFRFGNIGLYLIARLVALAIDLVGVAFVIATFLFYAFERGFVLFAGRDEGGFALLASVSFGSALVIAFVLESLFGMTLGKAIFGLDVRRADGKHAGVFRILVRYLLRAIDIFAIGPLLALLTPRHQRLGDLAGGTVVSRSPVRLLASLVGIVVAVGVVYLQIAFGGGVESGLGVTAEAASYGPDLAAKAAALVGIAVPNRSGLAAPVVVPTSTPSARAVATPSAAPADTPAPDPDATETPNVQHI